METEDGCLFADQFWGEKNAGFDVLYHNMKLGHLASKEFSEFLRESCSAVETYAKSLGKISKIISGYNSQSTMHPVWLALKTLTDRMATLHHELLTKWHEMIKEVQKYSDELNKKHKKVKESESSTNDIVQAIQQMTTQANKAKDTYHARTVELERLKREGGSQKELEKAETKAKKSSEDYHTIVEKYNNVRNDFETKLTDTCKVFQKCEEQHLNRMHQFVTTYTCAWENHYELLSQVGEDFHTANQSLTVDELLRVFTQARATGRDKPRPLEFEEPDLSSIRSVSPLPTHAPVNGEDLLSTSGTGSKRNSSSDLKPVRKDDCEASSDDDGGFLDHPAFSPSASAPGHATQPAVPTRSSESPVLGQASQKNSFISAPGNVFRVSKKLSSDSLFGLFGKKKRQKEKEEKKKKAKKKKDEEETASREDADSHSRDDAQSIESTESSSQRSKVNSNSNLAPEQDEEGFSIPPENRFDTPEKRSSWSSDDSDSDSGYENKRLNVVIRDSPSLPEAQNSDIVLSAQNISIPVPGSQQPPNTRRARGDRNPMKRSASAQEPLPESEGTADLLGSFDPLATVDVSNSNNATTVMPHSFTTPALDTITELNRQMNRKVSASSAPKQSNEPAIGRPATPAEMLDELFGAAPPTSLPPTQPPGSLLGIRSESVVSSSSAVSVDRPETPAGISDEVQAAVTGHGGTAPSVPQRSMTPGPGHTATPPLQGQRSHTPGPGVLDATWATSNKPQGSGGLDPWGSAPGLPDVKETADSAGWAAFDDFSKPSNSAVPKSSLAIPRRPPLPASRVPPPVPVTDPPPKSHSEPTSPPVGSPPPLPSSAPPPVPAVRHTPPVPPVHPNRSTPPVHIPDSKSDLMPWGSGNSQEGLPVAVAFSETAHACFKGDDIQRCMVKIQGEMMMSFPASMVSTLSAQTSPAVLRFTLQSAYMLKNVRSNNKLIQDEKTEGTSELLRYSFHMSALLELLRSQAASNPSAKFFNIDLLKYEVAASSSQLPIILQLSSKSDPTETQLRMCYSRPSASVVALNNVSATLKVDGTSDDRTFSPHADWNAEKKWAIWKLGQLAPRSDGELSATLRGGNSGSSAVALQFDAEGSTLSGARFSLLSPDYCIKLMKQKFSSGRFLVEPAVKPGGSSV